MNDVTVCPSCNAAVIPTPARLLDASRTTTGPWKRDGSARSPAAIYISTTYGHRDGYAAHFCHSLPKDSL